MVSEATAVPIEDVETSPFMTVELKGRGFEITPLQAMPGGEQLLRPAALWEFDVLPRAERFHPLQVCVAMRIRFKADPTSEFSYRFSSALYG